MDGGEGEGSGWMQLVCFIESNKSIEFPIMSIGRARPQNPPQD